MRSQAECSAAGRGREDSSGHECYGKDSVVTGHSARWMPSGVGRLIVSSDEGECQCWRRRSIGEPHVGTALVVMNDIGGDVVDCAVGWAAPAWRRRGRRR